MEEFKVMCMLMMLKWRSGEDPTELEEVCSKDWPRFGEDWETWKESACPGGKLREEFRAKVN